jgi:hypothetical protein
MQVSKNISKGSEIKDLRTIKSLAEQGKSIVVQTMNGWHYVRPAAWVLNWSLVEILKSKFYLSVRRKNEASNNQ